MTRWRVTVSSWSFECDANDEGEALMDADGAFNFMNEARAEEVFDDSDGDNHEDEDSQSRVRSE